MACRGDTLHLSCHVTEVVTITALVCGKSSSSDMCESTRSDCLDKNVKFR